MSRSRSIAWCLLAFTAAVATAQVTPAAKCRSKKNQIAGKYSECRQKAEGKLALDGDATKYGIAIGKCLTKYDDKWVAAEAAAVGACQTTGDQTSIEGAVSAHTTNAASALAGGPLDDCDAALATCEDELALCEDDPPCVIPSRQLASGQTTCSNAAGTPIPCAGTGQDGDVQAGLSRLFTDNGDGTVSDQRTGLMWEKMSADGTIHAGGSYNWNDAIAVKIATLNTTPCFAGHCDWRLPNVIELQSLSDYGTANAIVPAFVDNCVAGCDGIACSCGTGTWTSTQYRPIGGYAFVVTGGVVAGSLKTLTWPVQAVRGGL
jgi:hypothetical protein